MEKKKLERLERKVLRRNAREERLAQAELA